MVGGAGGEEEEQYSHGNGNEGMQFVSQQVGSSKSQLGRIYNSLVGRDNKGMSSNKRLLLESKRWKGEKEGHGSREREKDGGRKNINIVEAGPPPIRPLK